MKPQNWQDIPSSTAGAQRRQKGEARRRKPFNNMVCSFFYFIKK